MTKSRELRDMGDEQIRLVWKDAAESLFRLRLQAQTEKLAAPSEIKKHRRTIARCQTILVQRGQPVGVSATAPQAADAPQQEKHAKRHKASGRAKLKPRGPGEVVRRRTFQKRTQSGT